MISPSLALSFPSGVSSLGDSGDLAATLEFSGTKVEDPVAPVVRSASVLMTDVCIALYGMTK